MADPLGYFRSTSYFVLSLLSYSDIFFSSSALTKSVKSVCFIFEVANLSNVVSACFLCKKCANKHPSLSFFRFPKDENR